MNQRLIAIDGQPLLYRSYYQRDMKFLRTSTGCLSGGVYGFLRSVLALRHHFPGSPMCFAFDAGASWRNDLVETYKYRGTRTPPEGFQAQLFALQSFLTAVGYPVVVEPRLEADDLLAVMVTRWLNVFVQHTAIIVSSDRDFFQLVNKRCLLYDDRQKTFFGPEEVQTLTGVPPAQYLDWKCLVGDPSDNLLGLAGYGKKKAAQFIKQGELLETLPFEELRLVERNHFLMRLPRRVEELRIPQKRQAHLESLVAILVRGWTTKLSIYSSSVNLDLAQEILDQYECSSLNLADFLGGGYVQQ